MGCTSARRRPEATPISTSSRAEREGGRVRQRIIRALGRKDVLLASGELERLAASLVRHCDRAIILSDMEAGRIACTRIGGPLLFGRLWERLGIAEALGQLLTDRGFEFPVERAVFASVLHRLLVSGSDRSCEKWMADYRIAGIEELQLHHFYRAMAWLGEEIAPAGADALAPRCVKDLIEERLFERRRDLFSDLSLVFMDTTSLSFYGAGGESLGAYGHSKDHRADLKQMILAVVIDGEGRPICTEMLPGNTADATVLLPVVDRLRERFHIGRVCVVADRGMISAATIAALEERKLEYILGARERSSAVVRRLVLEDEQPLTPLLVERARGETQLFVKEVKVGAARYILCRNEAEAERERSERQAIVAGLSKQLARGDKALIGNSAYRRYLRRTPSGAASPARPSRSTPASWPRRRASTASSCCAPTPGSRRCRRCCATAICCRSRICSAAPRRSCGPARSIIPATPPSAAMCSARSSP